MKILITGSTGLIGSALVPFLKDKGHTAIGLSRNASDSSNIPNWNPMTGTISPAALEGADTVIHLAGANIADKRWTAARKEQIRTSRVNSTRHLSEALVLAPNQPKNLIVASAIGFYGERGDTQLDESYPAGIGFLPEVCQEWEEASKPVKHTDIRVVNLRIGIVLTPNGGALGRMLLPFKIGIGGVLGTGTQYMSWITLDDLLEVFLHILTTTALTGPVNAVSPYPVTNHEFTKALGAVLQRPTILPMPGMVAKLAFGEMADMLLLASTRVLPVKLNQSSFKFKYPTLEEALRQILHRPAKT